MSSNEKIETTLFGKIWILPILIFYFFLAIFTSFFISRRYIVHGFEYIIRKQRIIKTAFLMLIIKWFHSLPEFFSTTLIEKKDLNIMPMTFYGIYSTFLGFLFPIVLLIEKEDGNLDSRFVNINFSYLFIILTLLTIIFIIGYCSIILLLLIYFIILLSYFYLIKKLNIHIGDENISITSNNDNKLIIFIRKIFDFLLMKNFKGPINYKSLLQFSFIYFFNTGIYICYMNSVYNVILWGQIFIFCIFYLIISLFFIFRKKESTYQIITLIFSIHYLIISIYEIIFIIKDFSKYIHLNEIIIEMYLPALSTGITEVVVCYSLEVIGSYTACTFIVLVAPVILVLINFASIIGIMIISNSTNIIISNSNITFLKLYIGNSITVLSIWIFYTIYKTFYGRKFLISLIIFSIFKFIYFVIYINN